MKKMIKMSLVAAVAVTGLSSTVAAQPLTEAIKDVDVSGSIVYRYNDYNEDVAGENGTNTNDYKIATTIKSKVNDTITATVRVVTGTGALNDSKAGRTSLDNKTDADANPDLQVSQANFTAKVAGATVIAGKQGLTTPWTTAIDSDGTEQTGTGLLTLIPAGPVTVAAAVFNQTNLNNAGVGMSGAEDIKTLGLLGNAGPVALNAWYLDAANVFSTYTVGAKANIEGVTAELKYTSLDLDAATTDNSAIIAKVSTKVGPVGLGINYGKTDKEGGLTALNSTASTTLLGWSTTLHNKKDADMIMLNANMDVMSGLNVALNYNNVESMDNTTANQENEQTEIFTQITYKMQKNFSTYLRFGTFEDKENGMVVSDSDTRGRVQVEYKF